MQTHKPETSAEVCLGRNDFLLGQATLLRATAYPTYLANKAGILSKVISARRLILSDKHTAPAFFRWWGRPGHGAIPLAWLVDSGRVDARWAIYLRPVSSVDAAALIAAGAAAGAGCCCCWKRAGAGDG